MIITGFLKSGNTLLRRLLVAVEPNSGVVPMGLSPLGRVVLRGRPPEWPEACFVRLYEWSHMAVAIRHVYVKALVSRNAVLVPATLAYGFVRYEGQTVFAVLEEAVTGRHPERWGPEIARRLGQDLARWHKTRIRPWARAVTSPLYGAEAYHRLAVSRGARLQFAHRSLLRELERGLRALDCLDFRGPVALSHGDLHRRNVIVDDRGQLVWLDLDRACQRPCRHDLALAEVLLLRRGSNVVDAFEEQYFKVHAREQEAWRRHRLGWLRIASSLEALQVLTPREKPAKFGPWQRMWPAISSACWEIDDAGQPSGALVGEILDLAERNLRVQDRAQ